MSMTCSPCGSAADPPVGQRVSPQVCCLPRRAKGSGNSSGKDVVEFQAVFSLVNALDHCCGDWTGFFLEGEVRAFHCSGDWTGFSLKGKVCATHCCGDWTGFFLEGEVHAIHCCVFYEAERMMNLHNKEQKITERDRKAEIPSLHGVLHRRVWRR